MPANSPRPSDNYVDPALTNFSQQVIQSSTNFVGTRGFPTIRVVKQTGKYHKYNTADLNRIQVRERAPGTESAGSGFDLELGSYDCDEFGLHKDVTEQEMMNADAPIRPYTDATRYVTNNFLLHREDLVSGKLMKANTWGDDYDVTTKWDTENSTPITDVREARRTVQGKHGFEPNRMILGRETYDALLDNAQVLDRIKGGSTRDNPAFIMRQLLAAAFEVEEILVSNAVVVTSKKGATKATKRFVTDKALLYYAPATAGLNEPTAAAFFAWQDLPGANESAVRISQFPMRHLKTDRVEGEAAWDLQIVAPDMGIYFGDTNS